jgi:hypothetical protein
MCNSFVASASSRFNFDSAKILALAFLRKSDLIRNKLNKTAIEFKGCINRKLLTLLGHELCLV